MSWTLEQERNCNQALVQFQEKDRHSWALYKLGVLRAETFILMQKEFSQDYLKATEAALLEEKETENE